MPALLSNILLHMTLRVSCKLCDALILPTTAERTGGKCMPCFNDPHGLREAQLYGKRTSTDELLRLIEEFLHLTALRTARTAVASLEGEKIYGCWLHHTQFLGVSGLVIFTEESFHRFISDFHLKENYSRPGLLRWNPGNFSSEVRHFDEFVKGERLFLALGSEDRGDNISVEIERICLRVLLQLRNSSIFAPEVFFTLAEGDQSSEQQYAYGELFSTQRALSAFYADVEPLNWEHVEHYRTRIPDFKETD